MTLRRRQALLLLLAVMWAFGTYHGGRAALTHFQDRATAVDLVEPAQPVIAALQEERRLTALALAGAGDRDRLVAQRARTDQAAAGLRDSAGRARASWTGTPAGGAASRLLDRLAALPAARAGLDAGSLDRQRATTAYTDAVEAALRLGATTWPRTDPAAADRQRALAGLARAGELLAREDTLVSGAAGGLTDADRAALAQLAGARRALRADAVAGLAAPDQAALSGLGGGPDTAVTGAEDALLRGAGTPDAAAWRAAVEPALAAVHGVVAGGIRAGAGAAVPSGVWAVVQAGLFGGLGLVGVLAAYVLSRRRRVAVAGPDDGTAAVLLRLSQRNQALLHRQLGVLDELERREGDTADLAALFRADHLATQLRRNVEKAIILSGEEPGRRWDRPVPVVDVARAAASSVERYAAVMVASVDAASLTGPAVGDVTHLLTELIDNATRFAPGDATVWVTGELGLTAYTVVVQDRGPGMPAGELEAAREVLAFPYRPGEPAMSGLRLAGRLARKHDVMIELDEAPRGGIVARVRVPLALLVVEAEQSAEPPSLPEPRPGGLPMRAPRPVPAAAAGFVRRHPDRQTDRHPDRETDRQPDRPPVDRTARFRDRLAARGAGRPGAAGPDDNTRTVELPVQRDAPQHSTVDETAQP